MILVEWTAIHFAEECIDGVMEGAVFVIRAIQMLALLLGGEGIVSIEQAWNGMRFGVR